MASEVGQGKLPRSGAAVVDCPAQKPYSAAIFQPTAGNAMRLLSRWVLLIAIAAAFAGGVVVLVRTSPSGGGIQIILPTPTAERAIDLKVHISGSVRTPGVYEVEEGSRLVDVISAAGGATEDADLSAVNLAVRVKDEDHGHIPTEGEVAQVPATSAKGSGAAGKIDINTATTEQLKTLPGIGDVKAQAIVSYRESNGSFSSVEDLTEVRGIGSATLESIREMVEVR